MPGKQADITSFFSPKSKKVLSSSENSSESSEVTRNTDLPMKRKIDAKGDEDIQNGDLKKGRQEELSSLEKNSFSPDQKKRMLTNKVNALIKVCSGRLPFVLHENIGPSWFEALKDEFDKKYIQDLNVFLEKERNSNVKIFPPHEEVWHSDAFYGNLFKRN